MVHSQIHNNGPSSIKSLDVFISLPVSYVNPLTFDREILMDIGSVSIKSAFNGKICDVEWMYYNGTIPILDAIESPTLHAPAELNDLAHFGASKRELKVPTKRRSIGNAHDYNHYLQRIIETDKMTSMPASKLVLRDRSLLGMQDDENTFDLNDRILADSPSNRTIRFDCNGPEQQTCLQGRFSVTNFKANDSPILITLNFTVNLRNVAKIMTEDKDCMALRTSVEFTKSTDENR